MQFHFHANETQVNISLLTSNYMELSNIIKIGTTHIRFPALSLTRRTQAHVPAAPKMVKVRVSNKASLKHFCSPEKKWPR